MAKPYLEILLRKIESLDLPNTEDVLLECKHFFSGAALYANGRICASLSPAGFGLKLPEEIGRRLIEEGEGTELRYFEKAPVKKEYVALSQPVVDDRERMESLLSQSINYVIEGEVNRSET
jgi:TfoX/Sxy family transcriptional regulator of competence genes